MTIEPGRRDVLVTLAKSFAAVGAVAGLYVLARGSSGPASDDARGSIAVDLSTIAEGTTRIVNVGGVPVFIRYRPFPEVERARAADGRSWRDAAARNAGLEQNAPASDANRSVAGRPAWLVMIGYCTQERCLLREMDEPERLADGIGWICPCCASRYDLSGRVTSGPAPQNLRIPRHTLTGRTLRLGPIRG